MKIKKGYTLLELLLAISIVSMISLMFIGSINIYRSYDNKVLVGYCNSSIMMFINEAKAFSKSNSCSSYVQFKGNKRIGLYEEITEEGKAVKLELRKSFKLPNNFTFDYIKFQGGKSFIDIDKNGDTNDAGTITYRDMLNKSHTITMRVGSSYVEIKDT